MSKKYLTSSSSQTKKLGRFLAKQILKIKARKEALVIGLEGDLGSGKTTFLQGLAKEIGIKEKILSPTFVIIKKYKIKNTKLKFKKFFHIDCYRIKKSKEILELRVKEIISDCQNIVAVEWADKIKGILPKSAIIIEFTFVKEDTRNIAISVKRRAKNEKQKSKT